MWGKWSNGTSWLKQQHSPRNWKHKGACCTQGRVNINNQMNRKQSLDSCLGWSFGNSHWRCSVILFRWSVGTIKFVWILFSPESQSMHCEADLILGSQQKCGLTLVNCGIQYRHCFNLPPHLHDSTFRNGLQVWVPSSCFVSTQRKLTNHWCRDVVRRCC